MKALKSKKIMTGISNFLLLNNSSGHDNFRNSNSEGIVEDKQEESIEVEMLEKSPEMTVFISEKELSPADPFLDEEVTKKSRIQCLGEKAKEMQMDDEDNFEEEKEDAKINNI